MKFDTSKFLIGAYYYSKELYDDGHMKDLADMGIDFLVAVEADPCLLDLCEKYHIGAIASSNIPMWWGGDGDKAGQYEKTFPLSKLEECKKNYPNHPMLWGDYPVDEPNAKDFAHINAMIAKYKEVFSGQFPYINLYPNYASVPANTDAQTISQLGNATYEEHIAQYVKEVDTDYICFDFYPFTGRPFDTYLENLDIVARACRNSNRDMWVIIQTGAWKADAILDEFQIRWQAYLCLAYGTNLLMHASYCKGWWDEATSCVNLTGEKNCTYTYAKNINEELHALGKVFLQYTNTGVTVWGAIEQAEEKIRPQLLQQNLRNKDTSFSSCKISADGAIIAGYFIKKEGIGNAVVLVNTNNPYDKNAEITVSLTMPLGCCATLYRKGIAEKQFHPTFSLASGEGVFITY